MLRTNSAQPGLGEAQPTPKAGWSRIGLLTELQRLLFLVRAALAAGRRPWFALGMGASAITVSLLLHSHSIGPAVWHSGAVYASLPLGTELVRLPMSLFLPTPYLPLWGAVLQLVVVLGISELVFGRLVTLVVATIGHVGSTLVARVVLDSIHGSLFGLSPALVHMLDTGPSAAATAVGAYLLLAARMYRCTLVLVVALLGAALATRGIDGVEHMVALASGLLAGYFVPRRALTRQQGDAALASSTR